VSAITRQRGARGLSRDKGQSSVGGESTRERVRRDLEQQSQALRPVNREQNPFPDKEASSSSASAQEGSGQPGKRAIKPLDITVPSEIGRYTLGRRIGSGTCGVVHHALDNVLGRDVAIKLSPIGEAHVSTGKVPGAQRAYQTEIVAAGRLAHPNIVTVSVLSAIVAELWITLTSKAFCTEISSQRT